MGRKKLRDSKTACDFFLQVRDAAARGGGGGIGGKGAKPLIYARLRPAGKVHVFSCVVHASAMAAVILGLVVRHETTANDRQVPWVSSTEQS